MRKDSSRVAVARTWIIATWVALVLGLVSLVGIDSARLLDQSFPGFLVWDNGTLIALSTPSWTGVRSGLVLNRGRVVSVDGESFTDARAMLARVAASPPGTAFRYEIRSDGRRFEYSVPSMRLTPGQYASTFGPYILSAMFFFLIAIIAVYLRPDLLAARALAAATGVCGLVLALSVDVLTTFRFVIPCQAAEAALPVVTLYFALVFPVERFDARRRRMLVAAAAVAMLAVLGLAVSTYQSAPELAHQLSLATYALTVLVLLGMLASFGQAFIGARGLQARLQAGVVFAGGLAAFLLPAIAVLGFILLDVSFSVTWIVAPLVIFPLTLLYAVARHDLLHAERFIRLSVGYTLATSSVTLGYAVVLSALGRTVSPGVATSPAAAFALLLALGLSFEPLRRRIQTRVDRVFYRSSVDAGHVLEESSSELASLSDEVEIGRYVGERLGAALAVEWAELALGADGDRASPRPRTLALREALVFRGEVLGHLACGPKHSGAPFSAGERDLIKGLAGQAALAVRNARALQALREAQQILVRTERFAAIGELAGAVAHGIRNPLAGIRAAAQMAHEQAGVGPLEESLSGILTEADRLDQRIRTLLDFSRPFEPVPAQTDVGELLVAVRRAIASQGDRQGVVIRIQAPVEVIRVRTDPNYLEEALLELSGNALRAMPGGGELCLELARSAAGGATIRVSDSGGGIPEGVRQRVFELFFTTRPDGTGMGLAMVKKSVEQLGGTVVLEASGASGTRFRLEIPCTIAQLADG